jgi:hypothetical protein
MCAQDSNGENIQFRTDTCYEEQARQEETEEELRMIVESDDPPQWTRRKLANNSIRVQLQIYIWRSTSKRHVNKLRQLSLTRRLQPQRQ